jgi:hypothetical protein
VETIQLRCAYCDSEFVRAKSEISRYTKRTKFYCKLGCACSARNVRGKGPIGPLARYEDKDGYIKLLRPIFPGYERYARNKNGNWFALEHVVAMAQHLGRPLKKGETVHHKNGIRSDNVITNLELWSKSHPSGQRVVDVYNWAKSYIAEYEREMSSL